MLSEVQNNARLLVVRHSAVLIPEGLCYGRSEVPLAPSYQQELLALSQKLQAFSIANVYSSPAQRCLKLAEDLSLGPVAIDDKLQELNFGSWEGRLWQKISPHESESWTHNFIEAATPEGESFRDLIERVRSMLQQLPATPSGCSHLIVSHAGVIRALWHLLDNLSPLNCFDHNVAYGQIYAWQSWSPTIN